MPLDAIREIGGAMRSPVVAICAFGLLLLHGAYAIVAAPKVTPPSDPVQPDIVLIRIEQKLDAATELQAEHRRMIAAVVAPASP